MNAGQRQRINQIIACYLQINEEIIKPWKSIIGDLGADLLDTVLMTIAFEDEFHLDIFGTEFEVLKTVKDIYDCIEEKTQATQRCE